MGEADDSGSTKCDHESILVARAQRRRPEGVRTREASALEIIRLVLPNVKPSPSAGVFRLGVQLARSAEGGRQITTKGVIRMESRATTPEGSKRARQARFD